MKSPSEHQRTLLALLKPKSPMKLRRRSIPNKQPGSSGSSSTSSTRIKAARNILTSPNHTITTFFKKIDQADQQNSNDSNSKSQKTNQEGSNDKNTNDDSTSTNSRSYSSSTITRKSSIQIDLDDSINNDSDRELAERLQREYDQQWQTNNIVITPQKKPLRATDNLIKIDNEPTKLDRLKPTRKRNDDLSISINDNVNTKMRKTR